MKQQVKLKRCAVAVTLALAASYPARAQEADDAAPLTRVVVTGSNIKRVDSETASPVQVLSHQEIVQSGAQTVAEILGKPRHLRVVGIADKER